MKFIDRDTLQYRGATKTGSEFDFLEIHSASDQNHLYRFLTTPDEVHAINHPKVKAIAAFFELDFQPGKLSGEDCLVCIE